jgi:hypothetical protein
MKKIILISGFLYLFATLGFTQNEEDVLRYSIYDITGTARYMGLGGAYGAIGADFSSLSNNPAGIGLYKKSEFTISPSIFIGNSEGSYMGNTLDDGKNNFALGNVGIVVAGSPVDRLDRNPVKNYQFGFGLNRLKDFNNRSIMEGMNDQSSLLDTYLEYAGNKNPEALNLFDTRPAFDTYLIDTLPGMDEFTYINAYDYIGGFTSAIQRKTIETSGSMNEVVLSGGINLSERVYFGVTFGFPYMRYKQTSRYTEYNQTGERDLDEFTVTETLETKGSGFNIKFGTIFKATPFLRLGAAFHTPTWYNNITDKWSTNTQAYYTNGDYFTSSSPLGEFKYDIKTPWRASGSAALILGRMGLISAEYTYVDYTSARLSPSADFTEPNNVINNNFTQTHNFRVGTEVIFGAMLVRAGYAYNMSPFNEGVNDANWEVISGGIGYRTSEFFIDAALSYNMTGMDYFLYSSQNYEAKASLDNKNYNFILTLGYRFE